MQKWLKWVFHQILWVGIGFLPLLAFAQNNQNNGNNWIDQLKKLANAQDWQQMLINFASTFPSIEQMVFGFSYIIGFALAVRAFYYFNLYGELRTMMSTNASLRPPLTYLLVACVFLFLPTSMGALLQTVYGTNQVTPLSYAPETASPSYGLGITAMLAFIQLIGYIAFIRGWMIISHTAQQGARETIGKGVTHIIGGILAINVVGTRDILWNTFLGNS